MTANKGRGNGNGLLPFPSDQLASQVARAFQVFYSLQPPEFVYLRRNHFVLRQDAFHHGHVEEQAAELIPAAEINGGVGTDSHILAYIADVSLCVVVVRGRRPAANAQPIFHLNVANVASNFPNG